MLLPIVEVFMMAGTDPCFWNFSTDSRIFDVYCILSEISVFPHGKTRLTDRVPLWEQLRILGIPFI